MHVTHSFTDSENVILITLSQFNLVVNLSLDHKSHLR